MDGQLQYGSPTDENDSFHRSFKRYKQDKKLTDATVLDLLDPQQINMFVEYPLVPCKKLCPGLKPENSWKGYTIAKHPGLILLTNVMTSNLQKYLVKRCLNDLVRKPNKTNLDSYTKEEDINNIFVNFSKLKNKSNLLKKLRWITMGYHHNWDTKLYAKENKSEMPQDISELTECIAEVVGFSEFAAEAGIVNVYHKNSSLAGHVDNSEYDFSSPIISLSLGCTCIFLIGGRDKTSEPTAMYLRSGDVLVMSGQARLCYHAVPCIITCSYTCFNDDTTTDCREKCCDNNEDISTMSWESYSVDDSFNNDWNLYENFLKESRININTRQVHQGMTTRRTS